MRVRVEIDDTQLIGSNGTTVDGVEVYCPRCGHSVEVYGTTEASVRRGCAMLREECPEDEENYYVHE